MLHTSPLEQAGVGDAGGMNVYVVESAKRMAESGIGVDIYTRANRSGLPEVVEIADGVKVRHLEAGPYGGITKDELPSQVCALMSSFMHQEARLASNYYELVHSHYWISGQLGWLISERLSIPLVNNMHTMAKVNQPHKGPDVLIRAVSEMLKHTPSLRSRLKAVIIGGASGSGQGEIEKLIGLARFLGVSEVFEFLPPVAHEDLSDWYRASDLVCVPSYSESFGLVALEAQACGTPVVATAVGGLRTAVADGISGLLVDGHDPRAWSATISRLLLEPEKRLLLSMGAIEHASHF
ncbi:MAG: glycosyltransferase, partial [Actinobacteria bacterium]|nr:glycosyltransferase [Actinomycetota bacterium]